METSSSPNLGQHPSPSVMGSAGVWVRFRLGDLGGFRPPAHLPRAGAGCRNPFPGSIPLSQRNGRGPAGISAGTARTFPLISRLPRLSFPGKSLALISGNKDSFVASMHSQGAGERKGKASFPGQGAVTGTRGCAVAPLTLSTPEPAEALEAPLPWQAHVAL